jgi:hypothetical protein
LNAAVGSATSGFLDAVFLYHPGMFAHKHKLLMFQAVGKKESSSKFPSLHQKKLRSQKGFENNLGEAAVSNDSTSTQVFQHDRTGVPGRKLFARVSTMHVLVKLSTLICLWKV